MSGMTETKRYAVTVTRRGTSRTYEGTLEELTNVFGYTLETGKSYEHERGARKVNTKPKTLKQLLTSLENADDNRAANGAGGRLYEGRAL